MHPFGQCDVPHDVGRTANGAARTHRGAAGNASARRHGHVAPQVHVVSDLYQVVEFDAILDHCIANRATVNAGIGADFHIVANAHPPQLLDLDPLALLLRKAKTICTNDRPRMHNATLANGAIFTERDP